MTKTKFLFFKKALSASYSLVIFMRMVTCIDLLYTTYKRKSLENSSSPTGARFLMDGLVVPGPYTALSNDKKMVAILHRELVRVQN